MNMRSTVLAVSCLALVGVLDATANIEARVYHWTADSDHSSVVFETGHWGVVDIVGWFAEYEISVRSTKLDFSDAVIEARINPASVVMPNPGMATNLRNLFFEVEEFPEVLFRSKTIEKTDEDNVYSLTGTLTMKGITKDVVLDMRFNGYGSLPQGDPGFKLEVELDRLDFGVGGMEFMQGTGHPMVDPIVKVTCNIRLAFVWTKLEH
jgi:polyisoprenoid-binding protein YceI